MTKQKSGDEFFLSYVGEKVVITTKTLMSFTTQTEQGTIIETVPMVFEGIFLDCDKECLHLGTQNPPIVKESIARSEFLHIKIADGPKDPLEEMLEEFPIPDSDSSIN